jgi:hypothetical protein
MKGTAQIPAEISFKEIGLWFGPSSYRSAVQAMFGALEQAKTAKISHAPRKGLFELFCTDMDQESQGISQSTIDQNDGRLRRRRLWRSNPTKQAL